MNNLPAGDDLLAIAREALLAELRPLLPEHARYTAAMVANAMAIAARETEAGERPAREALERLDALYGVPRRTLAGDALAHALHQHERRLAAEIRAGGFDDEPRRTAALAHLRASVADRLRISNPKALGGQ
jgi:hypothetical protein